MQAVVYSFVCFVQLLAVSYGQDPTICGQTNLFGSSVSIPAQGVKLVPGFRGLNSTAYELQNDRVQAIQLKRSEAIAIGGKLDLSERDVQSSQSFSVYTMIRLFRLQANDPGFSQTQTLFTVKDSVTKVVHLSISLRVTADQTMSCFTCVKIVLVFKYAQKGGGPDQVIVLDYNFSEDLNDGQWHNLNIEVSRDPSPVDSTGFTTQVTPRIDCRQNEPQVKESSDIQEPDDPVIIIGGEGDEIFRGVLQDFFFSTERYQCIEEKSLSAYCPSNACTVDCKSQTAVFERELQSLLDSNDALSKAVTECETHPSPGPPTPRPGCTASDTNAGGTCTRCDCARQGQETCITRKC